MIVRRRPAHRIALGAALLTSLLLGAAVARSADAPTPWVEEFRSGHLDPTRWERTHDGDFREWTSSIRSGAAARTRTPPPVRARYYVGGQARPEATR